MLGNDINNNHHEKDGDACKQIATHFVDLMAQKEPQFKAKFSEKSELIGDLTKKKHESKNKNERKDDVHFIHSFNQEE